MKSWLSTVALLVALAPSIGCGLYVSSSRTGTGDDTPCSDSATDPSGVEILRNPETGECYSLQVPTQACGLVAPVGTVVVALPNWPACNTACDQLSESSCAITAGCHAYYEGASCPLNSPCTTQPAFQACGSVGMPAPTAGAQCESLDVDACANADWCRSFVVPTMGGTNNYQSAFGSCEPAFQPGT